MVGELPEETTPFFPGEAVKTHPWLKYADLTKTNPPKKTPGGKTIPKRYLKGLTKEEMQIAIKEIDKGYEYDIDDPEAYKDWKSDIKAKARGYKTVPSKYKQKFIEMYGPLPEKGKFLDKIAKATKIKKRICLLYTSPSPRDMSASRMPSSA